MPRRVVLLHGFTLTGRSWDLVAQELGDGCRIFAPDLPGHGSAALRRPASFDAVAAYLHALRFDRFALAGYSLGGRLALHAALQLRDRVERLVLVGATAGIADPAERRARAEADARLAERIEEIGVAAFVEEWSARPLLAGLPRGVAELAREDRLRNGARGLAAALRGMGTGVMTPLWDRLGELAMPVVLVVGARDEKFRSLAERMAERIPDAEVRVVADAGHAVHLEQPRAVADAILGDG